MDTFCPRDEGYFLKGNRINLIALEADLIADLSLRSGHQVAGDPSTGVLYRWDGIECYWVPARPLLVERIRVALGALWSEPGEKTVLGYLLRGAAPLSPPDVGTVAFRNFVVYDDQPGSWTQRAPSFDPETETWNSHYTGDWTAVIPHDIYVPDQFPGEDFEALMLQGTKRTSAFLSQVLPADAEEFAWEMLGNMLTSRRIDRKAILLKGEGANGKSRLLALIENLLGRDNVSHLPLSVVNKTGGPELGGLRDKLANIVDDMGTAVGRDISNFKTAVTGGSIVVNPKYQHPYEFEPRAKFAFAVNRLPHSPDTSAAWGSRWIIVPFDATFTGDDARPADVIDAELVAEASWIVTRAMHACARLIERGEFDVPPSFDQSKVEFEEASNPVLGWVNDGGVILDSFSHTRGRDLLRSFQASEYGQAYRSLTPRAFYEHLRSVPGLSTRPGTDHYTFVYGARLPTPTDADDGLAARLYEHRGEGI
jgi:P4 family phage/plasmid primase-like protien